MEVIIRKYQDSDKRAFTDCLESLVDYTVPLDPLKRCRRLPEFGREYAKSLLKKIREQNGVVYVAEIDNKTVGCVAGIVKTQTKEELLECIPSKRGRILDLFVRPGYRRKGIGKLLMKKIEDYFQEVGCDICRVEVFIPNKVAHRFYRRLGYQDRDVDMIKSFNSEPEAVEPFRLQS